jgi:hypothetical protein
MTEHTNVISNGTSLFFASPTVFCGPGNISGDLVISDDEGVLFNFSVSNGTVDFYPRVLQGDVVFSVSGSSGYTCFFRSEIAPVPSLIEVHDVEAVSIPELIELYEVSETAEESDTLESCEQEEHEGLVCQDGPQAQPMTSTSDDSSRVTTMGEIVPSLRSLTRRFTPSGTYSNNHVEDPLSGVGFFSTQAQAVCDMISYLYRFYRGSWRYKFVATDTGLVSVTGSDDRAFNKFNYNGATHIQDTKLNPIVEVEKPFYSPSELVAFSSSTFDFSKVRISAISGQSEGLVLKAAGDDNTYSYLVGAPVYVL